jgi:hypothetical protein
MGQTERPTITVDRASGLFLAYAFTMFGAGTLLMGFGSHDLVFPLAGGFAAISGIAISIFSLAFSPPPKPRTPKYTDRFFKFLQFAFMLLLAGFVFLGGAIGLGIKWMNVVGVVLSLPFIFGAAVLVTWVIPREIRRASAHRP